MYPNKLRNLRWSVSDAIADSGERAMGPGLGAVLGRVGRVFAPVKWQHPRRVFIVLRKRPDWGRASGKRVCVVCAARGGRTRVTEVAVLALPPLGLGQGASRERAALPALQSRGPQHPAGRAVRVRPAVPGVQAGPGRSSAKRQQPVLAAVRARPGGGPARCAPQDPLGPHPTPALPLIPPGSSSPQFPAVAPPLPQVCGPTSGGCARCRLLLRPDFRASPPPCDPSALSTLCSLRALPSPSPAPSPHPPGPPAQAHRQLLSGRTSWNWSKQGDVGDGQTHLPPACPSALGLSSPEPHPGRMGRADWTFSEPEPRVAVCLGLWPGDRPSPGADRSRAGGQRPPAALTEALCGQALPVGTPSWVARLQTEGAE